MHRLLKVTSRQRWASNSIFPLRRLDLIERPDQNRLQVDTPQQPRSLKQRKSESGSIAARLSCGRWGSCLSSELKLTFPGSG
jgi:hypothetical protein